MTSFIQLAMSRYGITHILRAAGSAALLLVILAAPLCAQRTGGGGAIPTPTSVIGFEPGTDRKLPAWGDVVDYFTALDRASPRVTVRTLGLTTLGRPFIAAFISDSATIARLPHYRDIQQRLADPRVWRDGERARLISEGKTVVLVTSSIHSTEVGGIMTPLVLAHRLAGGGSQAQNEDAARIRESAITILVPSLNPDGVDIVRDWYVSTLGTPAEGSGPPVLYHHYVGHDNNRDWYAFTQIETQLTIDSLHSVWHPQIVNDIHQQGSSTSRIFIPPFMDPIEPNVDPIITAGVNQLGMSMIWRLTAQGKTGIATNASYDAWTPARAYQHYHGGVRILTETASADLASPIVMPFDSLRQSRGYDAKVQSWNFLTLWQGGRWTIADIIDYQTSATWALLAEAARDRETWLRSFAEIHERAIAGNDAAGREDWPAAFVIPATQQNMPELATMLRILQRGQVEVRRARTPIAAGGETYPAGSYVIATAQPYGSFAKALLERQDYPDLREYPDGPPRRPYDVTAHTLPLLMGVDVATVDTLTVAVSDPIAFVPEPELHVAGLSGTSSKRIGMYRSYSASMDEGWTRWILDQYSIPYTSIVDSDVRGGDLAERFDVIIIPDQSPATLERGPFRSDYPDSLKGGLGDEGASALARFVENGGTLITFNEASEYAIEALDLPVRNVLAGTNSREFYAPGSLLRVELASSGAIAGHIDHAPAIWFEDSPAFEITDPSRATAVLTYPDAGDEDDGEGPLLSGWLLGGERLAGRAAMVTVDKGEGTVVLFGFRPQYRAQTMATYPLIWGAILEP
ncbi:MAG: M14 family zinc carboxypeptidase [Gemmatimonadaceae bacterium]